MAKVVKEKKEKKEKKAKQSAVETLGAKYGIKVYTPKAPLQPIVRVSTGIIDLDRALGGGIPLGRHIDIEGGESSGKSSLCASISSEFQKLGKRVTYIDIEHAIDIEYFRNIGFNDMAEGTNIVQPPSGDRGLEFAREIVNAKATDLIIVDSTAFATEEDLNKAVGESKVGSRAKIIDDFLTRVTPELTEKGVTVITISQYRANIGAMGAAPRSISTGGNAKKFSASVILKCAYVGRIKQGENVVGNEVQFTVKKVKTGGKQWAKVNTTLLFGEGYCKYTGLIDSAISEGVIQKGGAWLSYKDLKIQGKPALRDVLKADSELFEEIKKEVQDKINNVAKPQEEVSGEEEKTLSSETQEEQHA